MKIKTPEAGFGTGATTMSATISMLSVFCSPFPSLAKSLMMISICDASFKAAAS